MLDRIIAAKGKDVFLENYTPEQSVVSSELTNPNGSTLAVIFRPWHGGGLVVQALISKISKHSTVLDYEFHDQILEPSVERVPESFKAIGKKVGQDLTQLVEVHSYRSVHLVGMSLGSVAMTETARNYPEFSAATMVVSGDNLATLMWDGSRTQNIRRALSEQGVTKQELDEAWQEIAPINHADEFKNKKVKMLISLRDSLLPTVGQINLCDSLQKSGAIVTPAYTNLGHCATIARFCLVKGRI